jgi:two-component system cell cycle response regulator DivK
MAGEQILIVDDTPVNLKLTRILLVNEGYKVITAATAEEALELLRSYRPKMVLTDVQLPGIDGLELARRLRQDPATKDVIVVALTAFAMKGDEQKAMDAGCDGYITKPIDTRTLGARLREYFDRRTEAPPAPAALSPATIDEVGIPEADLTALRRNFLAEGQEKSRQLLLDMDTQFDAGQAARIVHQWIGTGGLLGYSSISRLAREVEAILLEKPLENSQLRECLANLAMAFSTPREARDAPIPEYVTQTLAGKHVAVVGLRPNEEERLGVALERVKAGAIFFEFAEAPETQRLLECDLAVIHVRPETTGSPWLDPNATFWTTLPVVLVGTRDDLLEIDQRLQSLAREFLMDSWQPDEALVRLSLAVRPKVAAQPSATPVLSNTIVGRPRVLIADDDPTVLTLVRTALQNFGMDCQTAADGTQALAAIRSLRPHAAVLDVNMPGLDGFEVLSAARAEQFPGRVLLLTARQQESDVIRGFSLGADDYVIKPFSPMELVARLKRLLGR